MDDLRVTRTLVLPAAELEERFARSGGPGGQHVNTSATKAELRFDVAGSAALSDDQKAQILEHLDARLTSDGVLVVQASEHRSQARNRAAARGRLVNLLAESLAPRRTRRATRPSRAARRRRVEAKRRRAETKALRKPPEP